MWRTGSVRGPLLVSSATASSIGVAMAACLIPVGQVEDKHLLSLLQDMDVFDFCVDFDIVGYPKNRGAPVAVTPIVSVDSDLETTWVALTNVKVW